MRPWALLPLLASGCLYLDGINQPPTVSLDDAITSTYQGAMLTVDPLFDDPEDGKDGVRLELTIQSGDDQPLGACDSTIASYGQHFEVAFYRPGIFRVVVVARDSGNATAMASEMVTITNAPPVFMNATIKQTSTRDACDVNAAGDPVTLALDGSVSDADIGAHSTGIGCSNNDHRVYTWRINDAPGGMPVLTPFNGTSCTPPTAASGPTLAVNDTKTQVCLWTDPMVSGSAAMYTVVLDVTDDPNDKNRTVESPPGNVVVSPDQPPCITGSDPVAGSYVVDRTELQEFKIDGVIDDRDTFGGAGITFLWSVWREADQVWREVPDYPLSTYQLDVSAYGVGEKVRVRAEALDRSLTPVSSMICPVDQDDCVVPSCASVPNVCHKWKTWDLELR
jgi:hypothetical protein